jgi:hypothetical protein
MTEFRAKRAQGVLPGKANHAAMRTAVLTGSQKRRGVRVNSRVPIAVEWDLAGEPQRDEAQTRVVGPYGCLVVLPHGLDLKQRIQLTNLVSKQSNPAVIVWRGNERSEGWELGIELVNPQMDFWGLEL